MVHLARHGDALMDLPSDGFLDRRAEQDHHRIADELVDGAAICKRDIGHLREIVIHHN